MLIDSTCARNEGSSPLTRGKHVGLRECDPAGGLIPAHAGKTKRSPRPTPQTRAHPRSRGENATNLAKAAQAAWLIPAHAGKTCSCRSSGPRRAAHPRSRGENRGAIRLATYAQGSSPLTRGKPRVGARVAIRRGLIPAHAGKTPCLGNDANQGGAHPRSRGENSESPFHESHLKGSSPLTRGKPISPRSASTAKRLIPAHAGKTH